MHPLNALEYIIVTLSGIVISFRFSHFLNAFPSIDVTVSGIVIFSRPSHPKNRFSDISVTPFSNATVFNPLQYANGPSEELKLYALFNDFGISILVILSSS